MRKSLKYWSAEVRSDEVARFGYPGRSYRAIAGTAKKAAAKIMLQEIIKAKGCAASYALELRASATVRKVTGRPVYAFRFPESVASQFCRPATPNQTTWFIEINEV